jgi:hypothetical protein
VNPDEDRAGPTQQGFEVGKVADDVGAALDLLVSRSSGSVDQIFFRRPSGTQNVVAVLGRTGHLRSPP